MGNYNDALLEQLADQGDGFYAYVNTPDEARKLFTEKLTSALQTVALDAKAQVSFDRDAVLAYRLVGYENRAIGDNDFTNDDVAAGAIGAGHSVTALYALRLARDAAPGSHLATIRLRWTDPERGGPSELSREVSARDVAAPFARADPHFRFDAIVAATAELVRGSELGSRMDIRSVADLANREAELLPQTDEVHAFLELLDDLGRLRG